MTAPTGFSFVVYGLPKAQPRTKARRIGQHAGVYTPKTADAWKALVVMAARAAPGFPPSPVTGPVSLAAVFYLPRPKRLMRKRDPDGAVWCPAKPDVDNLIKALADALSQAGVWRDDAQVTSLSVAKLYAEKGGAPRADVFVSVL